jgi:hypothetical protein
MDYLETAATHLSATAAAADQPTDTVLKSTEVHGRPSPEGMSLTIQYVREGLEASAETLLANILQSWRHQSTPRDSLDKLKAASRTASPSRWSDAGNGLESRWTRLLDEVSSSHATHPTLASCQLPPSTLFEHEQSASRLNDLSEWQFASSSAMESTKHSTHCFMHLVEAIAAHPSVLSLTVQGRPVLLNYDARGMVQSGNPVSTPFSDIGLYGEGQIVGVTDSGLDDYSCFFWDNSGVYSTQSTTRSVYTQPKVESARRKVVQYIAYADSYDQAAGHGTHVVGTIVGDSIFDGYTKANGVAPAAKVAFYDVMSANSQYLSVPDTYNYVYTSLYNAGARVLSNSWGSYTSETQYTERQYDADNFAYKFPVSALLSSSPEPCPLD